MSALVALLQHVLADYRESGPNHRSRGFHRLVIIENEQGAYDVALKLDGGYSYRTDAIDAAQHCWQPTLDVIVTGLAGGERHAA